jgi:hypothetical protein
MFWAKLDFNRDQRERDPVVIPMELVAVTAKVTPEQIKGVGNTDSIRRSSEYEAIF